jgi:hypothetical protein
MKHVTRAPREEGTGIGSYGFLIVFIAAVVMGSAILFGNEWNSLMYTIQAVSAR